MTFQIFPLHVFMINFCDVAILQFEMVQHIIFMLQYIFIRMLQYFLFDVAAYNF